MTYKQSQIDAVRDRAKLHGVVGELSDDACIQFLDWWFSVPKPKTLAEAAVDGFTNGRARLAKEVELLESLVD